MSGGAESADPARQRHLVTVWNPSYTDDDVMDAHLRILLDAAARHADGVAEDEPWVWWGKLRSANREQDALANERDILDIEAELAGDGGLDREVHLYVTDYRSLYVGHVVEITREDVTVTEPDRVPRYYAEQGRVCDFWFRLHDIRRIVADDLHGVIEELRKLENVHYHDRPVSLYGGMVNLPLVVRRPDGDRFFRPVVRQLLADGLLWAQYDARHGGDASRSGAMQRELRENLFGDEAWAGLEPVAREFIASAERLVRAHRGDAAFDFTPVVLNLAKALEVQCTTLLRRALQDVPREARLANVDGRTVDLATHELLTLGQLFHALRSESRLRQALAVRLRDSAWFLDTLPRALEGWPDLRNRAAHSQRVERGEALAWRNELVGVGGQGVLVRLGGVRPLRPVPVAGG